MSDKKIIEFIGRVERINYPKNRCFISNGEYGIVKMRCIENISNAETKKLYSLKGNCCEMEENGFEIISGQFERIPTTELKKLTPEEKADVDKLLEKIENDDDVQNVYHLMDTSDAN